MAASDAVLGIREYLYWKLLPTEHVNIYEYKLFCHHITLVYLFVDISVYTVWL